MITFNINTLLDLAGAALGLCALLSVFLLALSLRRWRRRCLALEENITAMRREIGVMASISLRTGRRVQRIQHEYSGVADRVELVELRGSTPSFDRAIDSARHGTDPGRLTQQFGLSCAEADLVTRLHGRRKTA
ncbi:MAG TPA: DUF2802 domain-containing protein [Steroidobacteraceae bacterium]|jgi:hypothetical protein|nr:DUF2802 domain-containing protein [Steroidobacteraceae bacterium]